MITLTDSLQLAYTKIRTRRIRLLVVLIVASLLFAGLIGSSLVVTGGLASFKRFSDEGFSNRYILAGRYVDSDLFVSGSKADPALVARIEALEKKQVADKVAEAKRLGITYSKDQEKSAIQKQDGQTFIDYSTQSAVQAMSEVTDENAKFQKFKQQASGAKHYYESVRMPMSANDIASLSVIKDNKEAISANTSGYDYGMTRGVSGMTRNWTLMDKRLLSPFLLPGQTFELGKDGSIPIVASYSAAQEVLGLSSLKSGASSVQKKERLESVRSSIAGKTFRICYRNATSKTGVLAAEQQQVDILKNKNKVGFEMPQLVYKPSSELCQSPVVQRDVRSADEKSMAAKQASFDRTFGKADPVSQIITFRIVGISQDRSMPMGNTVVDIFTSLFTSSLGASWTSPMETYDQLPLSKDVFKPDYANQFDPQRIYFAEYATADQSRDAYKIKNCTVVYPGMPVSESTVECKNDGRSFELSSFGSASLAIEEFQKGFRQVQLAAAGIIAIIASITLMGMIGRIIADSRKETAVFRAVGASRFAIAQIYITYTVYLAILTIIIASCLGFGLAFWINHTYAGELGNTMALIFNVSDLSMPFRLYGLSLYDMGLISSVILGASLLGSIFPIIHNVRRNPIRDMREE